MRRSHNQHLGTLPTDREVLRAIHELNQAPFTYGVSAQSIAYKLGISGAARLGNGAVKGTWSGKMAPALRIAPRLESFARQGLVHRLYGDRRYKWVLTQEGERRCEL